MPSYLNILAGSIIIVGSVAPGFADPTTDFATAITRVLQQKNTAEAEKLFLKDGQSSGRNQLLYLYELAGIYHLTGDFARSAALLDQADAVARENEGKALVSVTGGAAQVGAALTNDTILKWEGAPFDKVLARTLNALNYIGKKDLEGAKVEVRKAEEYQAQERKRTEAKVEDAQNKDMASAPFAEKYGAMFSFVSEVRNSYENAFTYYLASQIYRASGKDHLDDALVDIKQAYAMAPAAPVIQAAYLDLLTQDNGPQNEALVNELRGKLNLAVDWKPADPAVTGNVVVVHEAGFAPHMSEVSINLRLPKGDLFSMAFPIYQNFGEIQPPLQIQASGLTQTTSMVVDIRPLAVKNLKERMPAILTRGTLGAVAKMEGQKEAEKNFGFFGKLAAKALTAAITNADLRSWQSLPSEIQAAQFTLPAGTNELNLAAYDWAEKVLVKVVPGATTFVTVRSVPGFKTIFATTAGVPDTTPAAVPSPLPAPAPTATITAPTRDDSPAA